MLETQPEFPGMKWLTTTPAAVSTTSKEIVETDLAVSAATFGPDIQGCIINCSHCLIPWQLASACVRRVRLQDKGNQMCHDDKLEEIVRYLLGKMSK